MQGGQKHLKNKDKTPKENQTGLKIMKNLPKNTTKMIRDTTGDMTTVPLPPHLREIITEDIVNQNAATMNIATQKNHHFIVIEVTVAIDMRRNTTLATMTGDTEKIETTSPSTSDREIVSGETTPHQTPRIPTTTNTVTAILRSPTKRKKQLVAKTIAATVQSKKENEASD